MKQIYFDKSRKKKYVPPMKIKGYLYIITAAILWGGVIGPFGKMAFQEGLLPLEVAFWRAIIGWTFFLITALFNKKFFVDKRDLPGLAIFGFLCVTLFFGSYQIAVEKGGAALAAVLLYTAPAWVVLLSRIFLKEKFTANKCLALFLTLTGVILISVNQSTETHGNNAGPGAAAVFFGLLSGFCYSLYYILGKHFSDKYSTSTLFLYTLPFGALGLLPWVSFTEKTSTAWFALVVLAFFSTFAAYTIYYLGLRYVEPGKASIIATIEPVAAAVVAWLWWGEYFSLYGYAGSILVLSAVILMVLRK